MEEDEQMFPPPPEIEEHVLGSLRILTMMGQVMELYIPKAFEMFIATLGGTMKKLDQNISQELPKGTLDQDSDTPTPGMAGISPEENDDLTN